MKNLKGSVAFVTGGANGIGKAVCEVFAEHSVSVAIVDLDEESGLQLCEKLKQNNCEAVFIKADTSNEDEVINAVQVTAKKFGTIDILVNCAACFIMKGIEATVEDWHKIMSVNIMGYALTSKHCVPFMQEKNKGAIVHVCSISAYIAQPNFVTYSTTKGAIASMTRCMALDLAKHNIRVNAINPGTVWTESNEKFIHKTRGLNREQADQDPQIGGLHILNRVADPSEIADAILFLASDSSSFVTASNLMVDGGYTSL